MDIRCMSFPLHIEETTSDDKILIDNCHHDPYRSEIIVRMEVGLES